MKVKSEFFRFTDGEKYCLAQNNGPNGLHGGLQGFDKVIWKSFVNADKSVTFTYLSQDGEEGYPGNVLLNITYHLTSDNGLNIGMKGLASKATPINVANHVYFNLAGHQAGTEGEI